MKKSIFSLMVVSTLLLCSCGSGSSNNEVSGQEQLSAAGVTEPSSMSVSTEEGTKDATASLVEGTTTAGTANARVIHLKAAEFKEKVFNYEKNPQAWIFEGDKPCIVDFYADWCKPCKLVAPIMDELAVKYAGQINIYKVNTDDERELASVFGIRSIPSVLFCPASGKPQMTQGALPKETFEEVIQNFLLAETPAAE